MSGEAAHIRELESVLRKGLGNHELQLVEYSCRPLMPLGENYASVVLKVDATIRPRENAKTESLHLVAKTVNATDKTVVTWSELLPKEVFAYKRVLPAYRQLEREAGVAESDLIDVAPAYYGSRMSLDPRQPDLADDDSLLLVENLCTRGYYNCNKAEGTDAEHAVKAMTELARFHAIGIAMKQKKPDLFREIVERSRKAGIDWGQMDEAYRILLDDFRTQLHDELKANLAVIEERIAFSMGGKAYSEEPSEPWATICHGDFWLNNMLFHKDEATGQVDAVKFIDYQIYPYASPLKDVAFFVNSCLNEEAYERDTDEIVDAYYSQFVKWLQRLRCNVGPYTRDAFDEELRRQALREFPLCAVAVKFFDKSIAKPKGEAQETSTDLMQRIIGSKLNERCVERILRLYRFYVSKGCDGDGIDGVLPILKRYWRTTMTGDCGRFVESTLTRDQLPKQAPKQQPKQQQQQQQRIDVRYLESLLRQCLDSESLVLLDRKISSLVPIDESYGSLVLQIEAKVRNFDESQSETVLHLVAKTLNKSDRPYFDFARCMKKEAYVYHELMPVYRQLERQMDVPEDELIDILPRYVGHRFSLGDRLSSDRVDDDAVLLMENLCLKGFYTCDRILGMDKAHAGKALEALARYHALGIALKQRRPDYFESRVVAHARINSRDYSQIDEGLDSILRMFHDAELDYRSLLERQLPTILERFEAYRGGKTNAARPREPWATVTHGDFWLKNVLYRKDDKGAINDVKLIDYQAYLFNSPLKDLPHFLYMGLDDRARERDFDALVDLYYDEFLKNLKRLEIDASPFTRPAFDEELKRQALDEMPMMILVFKFYVHDLKGKYENSSELMLNVFRSDCCRKPAFRERLLHIVRFYEDRGWL
ncbi:uncharacterized protein LOC106652979 [Trichogramma pretiosum]|uniref:uncharacterized protein LOC106652979 n=1 Tax=Trichogramma pretiosum TaxID=7493 RepID=UPI000C719375|nr:uncharacterized protein LOC106652979 [Trichogramma pretiosum]